MAEIMNKADKSVTLTHPRTGSHLMGYILDAKGLKAITTPDGYHSPIPVDKLIGQINKYRSVWFHYPYSDTLVDFLQSLTVQKFMLVRDPRDVIVSMAHYPDIFPATFMNYRIDAKTKLVDYSIEKGIDLLIDQIAEYGLREHERWRQSGVFKIVYYADIIRRKEAKEYTKRKRRGLIGSHITEMTHDQIKRSTEKFADLIDNWTKRKELA